MTKIALIAAPTAASDSDEPSLGQRDAELIVARLQMADLDFGVIMLDPGIDLAAQIDETLTQISEPIDDLVIYTSCQLAVVDQQECFLCLNPSEPDVGDALRDVGSVVSGRAERVLVVAELRHQDPAADHPTVRAAATAIESCLEPIRQGIELIAAVRPTGAHIERIPSRLTVGLLEGLDGRRDAMTAKNVYARAVQSTDLGEWPTGLIYICGDVSVQMRCDDAPRVSEEFGLPPQPAATEAAKEPESKRAPDRLNDSYPSAIEPPLPPRSTPAVGEQSDLTAKSESRDSPADLPKVILHNRLGSEAISSPADKTRPSQRLLASDAERVVANSTREKEAPASDEAAHRIADEDSVPISVDVVDRLSDAGPSPDASATPSATPSAKGRVNKSSAGGLAPDDGDEEPISIDFVERFSDPGPAPPGPPPGNKRASVRWPRSNPEEMSPAESAIADYVDAGDEARDRAAWPEALKSYKRALGRFGTASSPERARVYIRIGEVLRQQGKMRIAISNLEKAIAIIPDDGGAIEALIELYAEQKNWRSAAMAEDRFLEVATASEETLARLLSFGDRWLNTAEDIKRATERYERAAEMFPEEHAPLAKLLLVHEKAGHVERVLELRHAVIAFTADARDRAEQHHKLGIFCLEHGRDAEGLAAFEAALDSDPFYLSALEELANLLGEDQEWGELERIYQKAYDACSSPEADRNETHILSEIQHRMALLYRDHLEDSASALAALNQALEHRPRQIDTLLLAAEVAADLGDPGQALNYLRRAADLDRGRAETYHQIFSLAQQHKEPHTARQAAGVTTILGDATDDEKALYENLRDGGVPPHRQPLNDACWSWLRGPDAELGVDRVMAAIAPTVLRFRISQLAVSKKLVVLAETGRQNPSTSTLSVVRSMAWAAQYLGGGPLPALYISDKEPGAVVAHLAAEQSTVLGQQVLSGRSLTELAFLAGRHLLMRRPEYELVMHMQSIDELSTCFLAGLKLVLGSSPAAGTLAKSVSALSSVLAKHQTAEERADLKGAITAFSDSGGQADLRRWASGARRTATRAGFVLCGDLEIAAALLRSSCVDSLSEEEVEEHVADLCSFAVSGAYLKISKAMV